MLPVALNLAHRRVLVVGGGAVAKRKAAACLDAGARVCVVAPALIESFAAPVEHLARVYQSGDCAGFDLVFAATDNREVNALVGAEARSNKIWCNIADDPQSSDFYTQSIVRRGQIEIGVSTGRLSPVLARHLREEIENVVGPQYETLQILADEIEVPLSKRGEFWRAVLASEVLELLRAGEAHKARIVLTELSAQACLLSPEN